MAAKRLHPLGLARQFQQRTMTKNTWLWRNPREVSLPEGEINAPIGAIRSTEKMAVLPNGKPAVTRYRLLEYAGSCSF